MHRTTRAVVFGILAVTISTATATAEDARWVQYVPGGLEARAITDKAQCPPAAIDNVSVPMRTRSEPGGDFPIRVCSLPITPGAKAVIIDGVPVPLPVARPTRILLIGDTGCRLKDSFIQACNDAILWPFQVNADVASTLRPDLVIHVGDFYYRETACPPGNLGCAGSPFGDTWASWRADFFSPARLLLETVPWVFVRGNHEKCERGGIGWVRTLDPYPFDPQAGRDGCLTTAEPFVVDIGGVSVVVMDTATARQDKADGNRKRHFIASNSNRSPSWRRAESCGSRSTA